MGEELPAAMASIGRSATPAATGAGARRDDSAAVPALSPQRVTMHALIIVAVFASAVIPNAPCLARTGNRLLSSRWPTFIGKYHRLVSPTLDVPANRI